MDNYVGKRLDGRYEIQEIIGVGGMSVVYKAYDNADDRIVAVKILKDEFLENDEFRRRFKNESKAIAVLSHPNIVKVYDVSFGDKLQYIVMEYVDGITLKEYIKKQGAITWNDALFFVTQILRALQHAHDKGIVHRDIKPQNIILLPNGNIKVTDFGIARFSRSETKTMTESAIGSVHYISPEQARGDFTDERADIYSVGVVLYEMLAGRVPFEAENAVSVALMQLQADAKKLTEINIDIPLGLEQICVHAMQKNPEDRYQTATEMLLDIEEIIKNPQTTFDYYSYSDTEPTKYVQTPQTDYGLHEVDSHTDNEIYDEIDDEEYEAEEKARKKKVITGVIVGVIVLIGAIVVLVMAATGNFNTNTRKLENFVGMSFDELKDNKAYPYEFVAEYVNRDDVDPGIVVEQSPEAGVKALEGSTVTLKVSKSNKDIKVPNVYGKQSEKALEIMKNAGLTNCNIVEVSSETVEEDYVVYTSPKSSTSVSSDTEIKIYVSTGPSTSQKTELVVPDVRGMTKTKATEFLNNYGFKNIEVVEEDNEMEKDIVLSQYPNSGIKISDSDKIKIVVSTGVTTTAKPEKYTIKVKAILPITNTSDTLIVYVDGEQYASKSVECDGSTVSLTINAEADTSINVSLKLKTIGEIQEETVAVDSNKTVTFAFTTISQPQSQPTVQ